MTVPYTGPYPPQPWWWNNWVPDIGGDPISRAEQQEAVAQQAQNASQSPSHVPESYMLYGGGNPYSLTPESVVQGNLPIVGWTCQNSAQRGPGGPFNPYTPTEQSIDWEGDEGNAIGAGAYDQNQVVGGVPFNNLNQAPVNFSDGDFPAADISNPNMLPEDVTGMIVNEW